MTAGRDGTDVRGRTDPTNSIADSTAAGRRCARRQAGLESRQSRPQSRRAINESRSMPSSVCVFCGSQYGADPAHRRVAAQLGETLAAAGLRVIYGGGHVGLMGAVADSAMAAGGEVIGLIPSRLLEREVGHRAITELITTPDMFERKRQMIDRADAFVVLPGGLGTLDEL